MRIRYVIIPVVAVIVLLIVGVAVLAGNVDNYRPRVQAEMEKKLGRKVTLGHLGVHLFPLSIRADGFSIAESPSFLSSHPFATAQELYVTVGLFSLLSGNPEVKNLTLDRPQIELIHNKAGVWNFSTLGGGASAAGGTNKPGGSGGELSLNELKINDGQVAITDFAADQARSVYDHIDLKLTDFAPGRKFGIDVDAHLPGQGKQLLSFKGKAGPLGQVSSATPLDGHISLQEVSLAAFNRFSAGALPPQTDAVASGDADISSQGSRLSAKGDLKLQNAVLRGSKIDFPISARYDLSADRTQNTIQVRSGSVELGSTSFAISGDIDAHTKPANLNVRFSTKDSSITELAKLAGAFGVVFNPAYQVNGTLTADISAKGPATLPQLNGSIDARQVTASGGEIKQPVSVPELDLTLAPDAIRSNTFTATSGTTAVISKFALLQYATPNRNIDASLKTVNANIAELLNMAKAYGIDSAKGMSGTGKLSADIHVQGPLAQSSELNYSGNAIISGATLTTPALTRPISINSANAQFSQNSVAVTGLDTTVGSANIKGNLSARNFAAPDVQFNLSAGTIDTAELESLEAKQKPSQPDRGKPAAGGSSIVDVMTGSGTLAANTIKAEDIVLSNVHASVKLNRGVITLSPLTAGIFGGQESGTLALDLRPANTLCSVNAKLSGVDTNALLSAVSSAKDTLYGRLAADTNIRFALVPGNGLARTLNGTLSFNVTNGRLKNVNILSELSKVGKFLGNAPSQSASGTALRKLSGTLNIVNGVASTNNFTAALDDGSLAANGTMNLADQGLDLHMTAALANSTSQAVGGTRIGGFLNTALANTKGELVIPVLVKGTMSHPVFEPDVQALAKMKLNNLLPSVSNPGGFVTGILGGKGAGGILGGLLGGQQAGQANPNQQQQQQPADAINSILNQFGKKKKKQ
jgi:uncharacterized protein involved in outer membrane biogenesis